MSSQLPPSPSLKYSIVHYQAVTALKFLQVSCTLFPFCHEGFLSRQSIQKSWDERKIAAGHVQSPGLRSKPPPLKGNLLTPGRHGADSGRVSQFYHDGVESEGCYHRQQQQSCAH